MAKRILIVGVKHFFFYRTRSLICLNVPVYVVIMMFVSSYLESLRPES